MLASSLQTLAGALKLWRHRRAQALLSSLGIVVGVGGLVLVIALGQGARRELAAALGTLGTGSVVVKRPEGHARSALRPDRAEAAMRLLGEHLDSASKVRNGSLAVASAAATLDTMRVVGTDRHYQDIFKLGLHGGRFISDFDLQTRARVCVLGWEAGQRLFPRGQVLGQELRIGRDVCRVVGWLRASAYHLPRLEGLGLSETDQGLFVPLSTLDPGRVADGLDQLVLRFHDEDTMSAALGTLKRILGYGTEQARLEYLVPIELLRQKQRLQQLFQYLLLGITALMLLVGGVGIMNMMMLNVLSRRAEIGLRLAIGGTPRDIARQFMTESSVITLAGGLAGLGVGWGVARLVDLGTSWSMEFNGVAALVGFSAAVAIGLVFGHYPARQAASVSPVKALHEL